MERDAGDTDIGENQSGEWGRIKRGEGPEEQEARGEVEVRVHTTEVSKRISWPLKPSESKVPHLRVRSSLLFSQQGEEWFRPGVPT